MTKIFTILAFIALFSTASYAQFTMDDDTFNVTYNSSLSEFSTEIHFSNTSGSTLITTWNFTDFSMVPSGWSFGFCDNVSCYPVTVTDNRTNNFSLQADSSFTLSVHISPYGQSANILVPVNFNGGMLRTTIYLKININATGIETPTAAQTLLFPNPASNIVDISSTATIDNVVVCNAAGLLVYEGNETTLNVSTWNTGLYYAAIHTRNAGVIRKSFSVIR